MHLPALLDKCGRKKQRYDPDNFFRINQIIPPGWSSRVLGLRCAQLVREDAVLRCHQLVLWPAGRFLHGNQMVERGD
ncbi:hypothetical protein BH18ACT12_BH18ACT12_04200 [soil metagenome]